MVYKAGNYDGTDFYSLHDDSNDVQCFLLFIMHTSLNVEILLQYTEDLEPPLMDTPNRGHYTFNFSIKDKNPYITMAIQLHLLRTKTSL